MPQENQNGTLVTLVPGVWPFAPRVSFPASILLNRMAFQREERRPERERRRRTGWKLVGAEELLGVRRRPRCLGGPEGLGQLGSRGEEKSRGFGGGQTLLLTTAPLRDAV